MFTPTPFGWFCMSSGGSRRAATARRHLPGAGSGDSSRVRCLASAGKHVRALQVRYLVGPGRSPPPSSSAVPMTRWCTASVSGRPDKGRPRWETGGMRSGCGCIPTTPRSCAARTTGTTGGAAHCPRPARTSRRKIGESVRRRRLHRQIGLSFAGFARRMKPVRGGLARSPDRRPLRRSARRWRAGRAGCTAGAGAGPGSA